MKRPVQPRVLVFERHTTTCTKKPRKLLFCLGRRIKQPQIDNIWRFLAKPHKCSPYGKSTTLHQSTRRHGVREGPAPARKSRNCPFRAPPSVRYRPRVAGPSPAFVRASAQRRIPRDTAKRHGPPPGALPRLIKKTIIEGTFSKTFLRLVSAI